MPEFLGQEEVDRVMATVNGEKIEQKTEQAPVATSGVRPYDLGSPDKTVRKRMQALEFINERFGRNMREVLINFVRRSADITVDPPLTQKFSEFERNQPVPSNINVVALKPLRGAALFLFDPNLVFLIIDNLFGGSGKYHIRIEGREFTTTEQRIIANLLRRTLDCYVKCWQPIYPLQYEYLRSEMHTKFANVTSASEAVIVSTFRIEFGTTGGTLSICLPYSMIEPIRDLLYHPLMENALGAVDQHWHAALKSEVTHADVCLRIGVGSVKTTVGKLMALKVGDVLPFTLPPTALGHVGNVPILTCDYGQNDGHYAISVRKLLADPTDFLPHLPIHRPNHD